MFKQAPPPPPVVPRLTGAASQAMSGGESIAVERTPSLSVHVDTSIRESASVSEQVPSSAHGMTRPNMTFPVSVPVQGLVVTEMPDQAPAPEPSAPPATPPRPSTADAFIVDMALSSTQRPYRRAAQAGLASPQQRSSQPLARPVTSPVGSRGAVNSSATPAALATPWKQFPARAARAPLLGSAVNARLPQLVARTQLAQALLQHQQQQRSELAAQRQVSAKATLIHTSHDCASLPCCPARCQALASLLEQQQQLVAQWAQTSLPADDSDSPNIAESPSIEPAVAADTGTTAAPPTTPTRPRSARLSLRLPAPPQASEAAPREAEASGRPETPETAPVHQTMECVLTGLPHTPPPVPPEESPFRVTSLTPQHVAAVMRTSGPKVCVVSATCRLYTVRGPLSNVFFA